jgi:RnfABCDGE-type electron transport complex B subunit
MIDVIVPIMTMAALGFLFASGLSVAYKKLKVEEDPKIEAVADILPQANCGACGYSGCRAFAEAVVKRTTEPSGCPVGGEDTARLVADALGIETGKIIKKVARVLCRGTNSAAKDSGVYLGIQTCQASHIVGGNKECSYGCLGYADCVRACTFDALHMGPDSLPVVVEDKCTACGKCVDACPRNIIELAPLERNIYVYCRSLDRGPRARKVCKNACIACGICVRACPDAIVLEKNLAKILDDKKIPVEKIPDIEKCPTASIGRLHKDDHEG